MKTNFGYVKLRVLLALGTLSSLALALEAGRRWN